MKLKQPKQCRIHIINECVKGDRDLNELTEDEFVWAQNHCMHKILTHMKKTNPMAFHSVKHIKKYGKVYPF